MIRLALLAHKCGTIYTSRLMRGICERADIPLTKVTHQDRTRRFRRKLRGETVFFIGKSDYRWLMKNVTRPYRGFHVVRDPRDVIVSGYFSHLHSHGIDDKWGRDYLAAHRRWLTEVPFDQGMRREIERGYALNDMARWNFADPDILEVRFEDLIAEPTLWLTRIFDHYEWPVSPDTIEEVVAEHSFAVLSAGRDPGQVDPKSHFRSGVPGDWKNHLTPPLVDAFKSRWGDLVVTLGYEPDMSWP